MGPVFDAELPLCSQVIASDQGRILRLCEALKRLRVQALQRCGCESIRNPTTNSMAE